MLLGRMGEDSLDIEANDIGFEWFVLPKFRCGGRKAYPRPIGVQNAVRRSASVPSDGLLTIKSDPRSKLRGLFGVVRRHARRNIGRPAAWAASWATRVSRSCGSTGLIRCAWKPAARARARSSSRA